MRRFSKKLPFLMFTILSFFLGQESFSSYVNEEELRVDIEVNQVSPLRNIGNGNEDRQYVIGEDGMPYGCRKISEVPQGTPIEETDSQESILDKILNFFKRV